VENFPPSKKITLKSGEAKTVPGKPRTLPLSSGGVIQDKFSPRGETDVIKPSST